MTLPEFSIRFPRIILAAALALTGFGVAASITIPRQDEPVITWRLANVATRLPGASAMRMESQVTDIIERSIQEVDEVEHVYSTTRDGVSLVQVELNDHVTDAAPVWQKVREKLNQSVGDLPAGTVGPELDDEIMGTFALLISVTSTSGNYRITKDQAQLLEEEIRYLPETASTSLFGVQPEVVEVQLDAQKLAAYELTLTGVAEALQSRNTRSPTGRLSLGDQEVLLETSGEYEHEVELGGTQIHTTLAGHAVYLRDVAKVKRTFRSPPEPLTRVDGVPAVILGVRARNGTRLDSYSQRVRELVKRRRPAGSFDTVQCLVVHDQARYAEESLGHLSRTLLLSVAFVFLSTAAFIGLRAALIVTGAIPLTGLMVLLAFDVLEIPIHQMSVMAIVMGFGLLVDNAIIVTEQIHRRHSQGEPMAESAACGPMELMTPLLVSTLTTIAGFLPIYLLPGGTGEFVRAIPVGVAACLLASLLIALTAVPWLYVHVLPPRQHGDTADGRRVSFRHRSAQRFERLLLICLARPWTTVVLVVLTMSMVAATGLTLRRDFFSPVQRDQFVIDVFTPHGSSLENTLAVNNSIERLLKDLPEVRTVVSCVGRAAPLVFYNLVSQETYANQYAQLIVTVDNWSQTAEIARRVQGALNRQIAGADCCAHILEHGAPFRAPFELRISGPSITSLRTLGRRAADILKRTPGVRNIRIDLGSDALKLMTVVNEPVARRLGLSQEFVSAELSQRLEGLPAGYIQEGDERIEILVRLPVTDRQHASDLSTMHFKPTPQSAFIPFSTVASIEPAWDTAGVYRRDGKRTCSVFAYPDFGLTPAQVSREFASQLIAFQNSLPEGYTLEFGGENEQRQEAEFALLKRGVYALLIITLILIGEFRSFRLAGIILALVPLSTAGTMAGLWLTGWPLNFMAIMGIMVLAGVVINDAVILVDGFERRRHVGEAIDELVVAGTLDRTRHILVTTITTIAGFLPLALSPSLLWPPLAIAIIGGLTLATILTLIGVPAAYLLCQRGRTVSP